MRCQTASGPLLYIVAVYAYYAHIMLKPAYYPSIMLYALACLKLCQHNHHRTKWCNKFANIGKWQNHELPKYYIAANFGNI